MLQQASRLCMVLWIAINVIQSADYLCMKIGEIAHSANLNTTCFIAHADTGESIDLLNRQNIIVDHLKKAGISTLYARHGDNGGLSVGGNIPQYMHDGIKLSDYVIMFFTRQSLIRASDLTSGISVEITHLLDLYNREKCSKFFIPIIMEGTAETSIPVILRGFYAITPPHHERGLLSVNSCMQELLQLMSSRIYKNCQSIVEIIQEPPIVTMLPLPPLLSAHTPRSGSGNIAYNSSQSSTGSGPMVREHTDPFHESISDHGTPPSTVLDTQPYCSPEGDTQLRVHMPSVLQQNVEKVEESDILSSGGLSVSPQASENFEESGEISIPSVQFPSSDVFFLAQFTGVESGRVFSSISTCNSTCRYGR